MPDDLLEIIYCDHFGNLMTGIRATSLTTDTVLHCGNIHFRHDSHFAGVSPGEYFWYENSYGLVEFTINQGNASEELALGPGDCISMDRRT